MTGTRDPQQDGSIQAMLRDSGLEASTELRSSLEELRALAPDRAPAPRADLAALLVTGTQGSSATGSSTAVTTAAAVVSLTGRRWGRQRRLAIVGGAVVGAMSLGAGAVAASSEDFRRDVSRTVGVFFQPAGHAPAPAPEHAQPSPANVPAVPAVPAGPAIDSSSAVSPAPEGSAVPAVPTQSAAAPGVGGALPTPAQHPVTPGVPAIPGLHGLDEGQLDGNDRNQDEGPASVMPTLPGGVPTKIPGRP